LFKNENDLLSKQMKNVISVKMFFCQKNFLIAFLCLVGGVLQAEEVANLAKAFQKESFPQGWAYLWNDLDALGKSDKYSPLKTTPENSIPFWTPNGTGDLPQNPGGYLYIGTQTYANRVRGHPGSPSPTPHYAIFAYTLSSAGTYSIAESVLVNAAGAASTGLELKVLVNDKEIITRTTEAGSAQIDFDTKLGELKSGDVVYVAVGPGADNNSDLFDLQFVIESE
jgi:hypothetical protein